MNREDIIRMAREAGITQAVSRDPQLGTFALLERLATLVAAAEREACARIVERYCGAWDDEGQALVVAIRARGNHD